LKKKGTEHDRISGGALFHIRSPEHMGGSKRYSTSPGAARRLRPLRQLAGARCC
jgi:hypothetical protein